jgi:hypothetical protein
MNSMKSNGAIAIFIALAATALLQIPYALGYATTPADKFYTGLLINVEDANYITIIQRGSEGAWMHSLRFTSEPDQPAFLYVFYLAWGHLARVLNLDATTMWHVARMFMSLVTFLIAYGFVRHFVSERSQQMVAYFLILFGAGFDWFVFPWENLSPTAATPVDLKMADAHLFSAALTFPHYLASIALLLILFWCALRMLNENLTRRKLFQLWMLGALANVGVVLVYPFFVLLSCSVLTMYVVFLMLRARKILWRQIIPVGALIVPVLPLVGYDANAFLSSELLRVWAAQSQTLSPSPLHYWLTYAPYLILALWDLRRAGLGDDAQAGRRALLWAWLLVVALLVYAPFGTQRRFLQGVQVPLAILATMGLYEAALPRLRAARWFQAAARRRMYSVNHLQNLIVFVLVLLLSVSSMYQWLSAIVINTARQPYPFFRPRAEVAAMDWLRANAHADDVVLGAYWTGSYLPLRAGTRTYLGHYYETIHFEEKQVAVDKFFDLNAGDAARRALLRENGIRFLFYGPAEHALGAFDPERAPFLLRVYANDVASVYRVSNP